MSSYFTRGTIPLLPDQSAPAFAEEEQGYPFSIPKVFLEGAADGYHPQVGFSWGDDTIVVLRGDCFTTYTKSEFSELLAEDENGNVIWVDGRNAPYEDCWSGRYLDKTRGAKEYRIVEYDLKTSQKRTYKVSLEETAQFTDRDLNRIAEFADTEVLGITFEIKDGVLEKYNGASANVEIPEGVTKIDWRAFCKHDTYENIRIPKSVVDFESDIFGSKTIAHIEVDPDNPRYACRDGLLIDKQTKTVILGYAGDKIPDDGSVTKIGSNAFYGRMDFKYMEIPDSVTEIGDRAFYGCANLEKVVIADSVTSIGICVFGKCKNLTEIDLPASITQISYDMFEYCTKLKSVTIPDSVAVIKSYAFANCSSLEKIIIPETVSYIGQDAFENCFALTEIKIPSFTTNIRSEAFKGCSSLRKITIPDSVLQIGDRAFYDCSTLEEIYIPDSVIEIGEHAFYRCRSLKRVRLPVEILEIPTGLFYKCNRLESVVIPETVANIGRLAFSGCSVLTAIAIPTSVRKIDYFAFADTGLSSLNIPDSVKLIGDFAFANCHALDQVNIPVRYIQSGKLIFDRKLIRQGDSTTCFLEPLAPEEKATLEEIPFL